MSLVRLWLLLPSTVTSEVLLLLLAAVEVKRRCSESAGKGHCEGVEEEEEEGEVKVMVMVLEVLLLRLAVTAVAVEVVANVGTDEDDEKEEGNSVEVDPCSMGKLYGPS